MIDLNKKITNYNTMKNLVLILGIVLVASIFIGGGILLSTGGIKANKNGETSKTYSDTKAVQAEGAKTIKVKTVSTDVVINSVEGTEVSFKFTGNGSLNNQPKLVVEKNSDAITAEIKYNSWPSINLDFNFINNSSKLTIDIPKSYNQSLEVSTVSGNSNIKSFKLTSLDLTSVSGEFIISDVTAQETTMNTTSGNAKFSGNPGIFNFESVSGDLESNFEILGISTSANTTSGDIDIKLPINADCAIDFSSVSGDYKFSYNGNNTSGSKSFSGKFGEGKNKIKVDSVSGDLELH